MSNLQLLDRVKSMGKRWQGFANLGIEAQYEHLSQIITLNAVEEPHLNAAKSGAASGRRKVLLPLAHEMTHWLDHIATSWGRRHLVQILNAYHARIRNNPVDFYHIVAMADSVRRLGDHGYYKVVGEHASKLSQIHPWLWTTSCGLRFSADGRTDRKSPIIFNKFYALNVSHETLIARVPISVIALTEANAMSAEQDWVQREQLTGTSAISTESWQKQASSMIHDVDYILYTCALHCVANHCLITESASAYAYVRSLATLCLNLPPRYFAKMKLPSHLKAVWDRDLVTALRGLGDPGFAFLVLCSWAGPTGTLTSLEWIEQILKSAGLPAVDEIEKVWLHEFEKDVKCLSGPFDTRSAALFSAGQLWAARRGILGDTRCLLRAIEGQNDDLPMPDILLGDGTVWQLGSPLNYRGVPSPDTEAWFDMAWKAETSLVEFLYACGRGG